MPPTMAPRTPTDLLHIPAAPTAAPLSAQQRKFNTLSKRIEKQRALLTQWNDSIAAYRTRYAQEFLPLLREYRAQSIAQVQWLDQEAYSRKGLTKAERATLGEYIADAAWDLHQGAEGEEESRILQALHDRYAEVDFSTSLEQAKEEARSVAQAVFGLDLEGVDMDDEAALMRRLHEHHAAHEAQMEQEAQARAAHKAAHQRKAPSARERQAQEAAAQASQSVREIYRKLASSLHPDRETDPQERERKTALMQRVNQAYNDNKLLDLLQLQWEIEQIDPDHMAGLSDAKLKHYNKVLAEQCDELKAEIDAVAGRFCMEHRLDFFHLPKPALIQTMLTQDLHRLRHDTLALQSEMRRLRGDPAALKPWIRQERQRQREEEAMQNAMSPFDEDWD